MKTQMMACALFLTVMLYVISYNSVFTQLTMEPEMSETCEVLCGSEVQQIYLIMTHLKTNMSQLEVKEEAMQSKFQAMELKQEDMQNNFDAIKRKEEDMQINFDAMNLKEEGMQSKIDSMTEKEAVMQSLIDSMVVKEEGMQNLIDAMVVKEEGMQNLIDAMVVKEEGMQNLIDAMVVKQEGMQSQINALETNEILIKTKLKVMDLTEENENLIELNTNYTIIAETEMDDLRDTNSACKGNMSSLQSENLVLKQRINALESLLNKTTGISNASNCADLYQFGLRDDRVYTVDQGGKPYQLYCDMTQHGGGWTVIQRRFDGSVDFYRNWDSYKAGFGNLTSEFWLGNDLISLLTKHNKIHIHIYLEDFEGDHRYAQYSDFQLGDEEEKYVLHIGNYSGDAGDSLTSWHKGKKFSTYDNDNDMISSGNCASDRHGAFWFSSCDRAHLNGQYRTTNPGAGELGLVWDSWRGNNYSLKKTTVKIRPMNF